MNYYIEISINNNLSVRQLRNRIKSNEYERLPESTKEKIVNNETKDKTNVVDIITSIYFFII